jgi:hypothetical protein
MSINIGHADTIYAVTVNSYLDDPSNGGAFMLTMTSPIYDYNTAFTLNIADTLPSGLCTTFEYYYDNDEIRYVIFCPYE